MLKTIFLKELKDSFRDRRTLLLTVFLPIVFMTALVFFYESMISDGKDNIYELAVDQSLHSELQSIIDVFDNVSLVKSEDPIKAVKDGDAHAAVVFSDDFLVKVNNGESATVTLFGDSFSNNSSTLLSMINSALVAYEKVIISERLTEAGTDPSIMQPFAINTQEISEDSMGMNLLAMLVPLILAIAIGIGGSPAAADFFAGEKEKKTMEALLMTPVNRSTLLLSKWLTIATLGAITGVITILVVFLEIMFMTESLKEAVSFGDNIGLVLAISLLIIFVYAMFNASILMLTSIVGKTVKEAQSYSSPIMMLGVFPAMLLSGVGVNELSFSHFAIPFMNIFSILKELLFGMVYYDHLIITIVSNLLTMLIIFFIGRVLFMKDKWVMN